MQERGLICRKSIASIVMPFILTMRLVFQPYDRSFEQRNRGRHLHAKNMAVAKAGAAAPAELQTMTSHSIQQVDKAWVISCSFGKAVETKNQKKDTHSFFRMRIQKLPGKGRKRQLVFSIP